MPKTRTCRAIPASVTKVMTLYLLFDAMRDGKISMNTQLRVSAHAAAQSPTKLGLSEGDTITVADAIGAIVTKSANDMAVAVGEALAGSEEEFARRMTQKARTIGMLHTTFRNASGLPNDEQKTTAQDLIVLGINILADHPERCKVFSTKYFQYDGEVFRNHNTLLFTYDGMEGMKTGFTSPRASTCSPQRGAATSGCWRWCWAARLRARATRACARSSTIPGPKP